MMRTTLLTLLTALTLIAAPDANAALITFEVELNGANENPDVPTPGTGTAEIEIDTVLKTMTLEVLFSGLLGNTTASHIHCCTPPTGNAGVATQVPTFIGFPLGVTSGTYSNVFDMSSLSSYNPDFVAMHGGTADSAFDFLLANMLAGQSYLNIHSEMFRGGEIRGTLIQVPEPGSLVLLGLALAGLAVVLRRRQVH